MAKRKRRTRAPLQANGILCVKGRVDGGGGHSMAGAFPRLLVRQHSATFNILAKARRHRGDLCLVSSQRGTAHVR